MLALNAAAIYIGVSVGTTIGGMVLHTWGLSALGIAGGIGGFVALAATFGGPVSGASMNPARSLGPAVASLNFEHLWIYLGATTLGTVMATPFCRWVQGPDCCPGEQEGRDT